MIHLYYAVKYFESDRSTISVNISYSFLFVCFSVPTVLCNWKPLPNQHWIMINKAQLFIFLARLKCNLINCWIIKGAQNIRHCVLLVAFFTSQMLAKKKEPKKMLAKKKDPQQRYTWNLPTSRKKMISATLEEECNECIVAKSIYIYTNYPSYRVS